MIEFNDLFGEIKPKNDYSAAQAIIIYGNMGTGKTTLAASCSESGNTVLVNFEGRISHIDETEQLRIVPTSPGEFRENARCNYDQFVNFAEYVLENKVKIKYLILDTLDAMLQVFIKGMLRRGEIQDKYYGRAEAYPKITDYIQRFKDNVKEVKAGYECGLTIEKFNDIKEGDIIEGYEDQQVKDETNAS